MPELPEVETVRRVIEPQVVSRRICAVSVLNEQVVAYPDSAEFQKRLCGQVIASLTRRGKFLIFVMDSGVRLVLHLRMTGQILVTPADFPMEKHTHCIISLSDEMEIRYIDVRRFGRFWYLPQNFSDTVTGIAKLGIEPDDAALTGEYLRNCLGHRKKPIKEMLLVQSVVCGIGNIYADEILFSACIHPGKLCCALSDSEWDNLAIVIHDVICWGIETNAVTPDEYLRRKGKEYRNTPYLRIYGKEGKPCPVCGTIFEKIILSGRGSCYCPQCQRE